MEIANSRDVEEAVEAIEWCRRAAAGKAISVLGHGVGATVALLVALQCKRQVKGVGALSLPPQGLPSPIELKKLKADLFFGIGTGDEVARPSTTQALHAACSKPKQLKLYPGATHELGEVTADLLADAMAWVTRVI